MRLTPTIWSCILFASSSSSSRLQVAELGWSQWHATVATRSFNKLSSLPHHRRRQFRTFQLSRKSSTLVSDPSWLNTSQQEKIVVWIVGTSTFTYGRNFAVRACPNLPIANTISSSSFYYSHRRESRLSTVWSLNENRQQMSNPSRDGWHPTMDEVALRRVIGQGMDWLELINLDTSRVIFHLHSPPNDRLRW